MGHRREEIYKQIVARNGYIEVAEMTALLEISNRALQMRIQRGKYTKIKSISMPGRGRGGKVWQIHISDPSIPDKIRIEFSSTICHVSTLIPEKGSGQGDKAPLHPGAYDSQGRAFSHVTGPGCSFSQLSANEIEMDLYAAAPEFDRRKADKYLLIIKSCAGMKGAELRRFVADWNNKHPEFRSSYDSVLEAREKYAEQGVSGLLGKYGKSNGKTKVEDLHFEHFKKLYLKEGGPSLKTCWIGTLGHARQLNPELRAEQFPSPVTFLRRLEKEIPKDSIYLARCGREAWNRKYGNYIDRDYSAIKPGEVIVSDHAQVDVAVMLPNGKPVYPWVTTWRCFKSGKWLGWLHHPEAPNSDHVFMTFYYAARDHGLPTDIYIDNGKDYRVRDFAGGRKNHRITVEGEKATGMLALLGITPHFALPYNAQTKPIERDFLKYKEWFSKSMPGYRGGHVKERPEKLKSEIRSGLILHWEEYTKLMDDFILNVLNKMPSNGKALNGMSPDELWAEERAQERAVSRDALKLFCMRTSEVFIIAKNGVRDGALGCNYWGEFMTSMKGIRVYLRRDLKCYQEAWVFRATDDEYLGKAVLAETASALARTDIEKAKLRDLIARKKQAEKITKSFIEIKDAPSASEVITHMAAGVEALNIKRGYMPSKKEVKVKKITNTRMDKVILKDREIEREGAVSLAQIQPPERSKKKLHLFECERNFEELYGDDLNEATEQ